MEFVPLWVTVLDSPKMHRLGPEGFGRWALILVTAQRNDPFGGELPGLDELSFWLRRSVEEIGAWIAYLVDAGLVDRDGDGYRIHDWDQWRCVKDKTARMRKQRSRAKAKQKGGDPPPEGGSGGNGHVHVTPPVTVNRPGVVTQPVTAESRPRREEKRKEPLSLRSRGEVEVPPLPTPAGGDVGGGGDSNSPRWERPVVGVYEGDDEPFVPPPPDRPPPPMPEGWQEVLDETARYWADDSAVIRMLKLYEPRIVRAACRWHYDKAKGVLHPRRLAGVCEAMFTGAMAVPEAGTAAPARPGGPSRAAPGVVPYVPRVVPESPPQYTGPVTSIPRDEALAILLGRKKAVGGDP